MLELHFRTSLTMSQHMSIHVNCDSSNKAVIQISVSTILECLMWCKSLLRRQQ